MMGFCLAVEKIVKSRWCGNVLLKKSFLCIKKGEERETVYIFAYEGLSASTTLAFCSSS
eukprot:COSAG06_NODE_51949_length_308_cov_17451.301435_2_plen_58_part_01